MRVRISVTGAAPLLMHNIRLADALDPIVRDMKKITSDTNFKKTDEGIEQLARLEWMGGLYFDETMGPYVPAENMAQCIARAATATRQGKSVKRALLLLDDSPLGYDGPRNIEDLWVLPEFRDRRSVKVGQSRVSRTRPRFNRWSAEFDADLDVDFINYRDFVDIVAKGGRTEGLGDFRPRFGRFDATVKKI